MFAQNILFPVSIYFWVYAYLIQAKELVETPFSSEIARQSNVYDWQLWAIASSL